jgi:hypothetical protein
MQILFELALPIALVSLETSCGTLVGFCFIDLAHICLLK